jgi:hypothetical protein
MTFRKKSHIPSCYLLKNSLFTNWYWKADGVINSMRKTYHTNGRHSGTEVFLIVSDKIGSNS